MTTKAALLPVPGIVLGAYPERRAPVGDGKSAFLERARNLLSADTGAHHYDGFIGQVAALDAQIGILDANAAATRLNHVRAAMARQGLTGVLVAEAFVLVKRACARTLGVELYPTQLLAARIMLDKQLAEMATGEGKTLAAALCAATAGLAGIPVHVITANDYLVARDAEFLAPLYRALGLTVAAVTQTLDVKARHSAYDCDIVYCTASELVFDYLRDGLVRGRARSELQQRVATLGTSSKSARGTLLQGLCMAVIDEADSVLIDDARVPLILSERCSNEGERRFLAQALKLASTLAGDTHFVLHRQKMSVELTAAGRAVLEQLAEEGLWRNRLHREETVCTALAAVHLYEKERHYLVRKSAVTIIDESTGRLAPGRIWSRGLHRLIELKEGCDESPDVSTVAQITYQRFFRRYLQLAGMSGTLAEARGELLSVYGLSVVKVPLGRSDRRSVRPTRLYPERESLWQAVVAEATAVSRSGRPVLIGTDSVAESEELSRRLIGAGVRPAVLNARQDIDEARVVAEAGLPGRITVATNMAGRGTDIALAPGVAERGGLHIISCQHNASRRIDRQLLGRCARRGDPGSAQIMLSLDKPLIARFAPRWVASRSTERGFERPQWLVRLFTRAPQRLEEIRQRAQRRALLRQDTHTATKFTLARPLE